VQAAYSAVISNRVRIPLAVLLLGLLGVAAWMFLRSSEPVYAGRSLNRWLVQAIWTGGSNADTTRAIRSVGTNALPGLLRLAHRKDSGFHRAVVMLSRRYPRALFHLHSAEDYHWMATWGFSALGPTGKPTVPALIRLLADNDEGVRSTAAACLGFIGPGAAEAVPALTQCLSDAVNNASASRETAILEQRTASALGMMGPAAQQAIPILTAATNASVWYARNAAKAALMRIRGESVVPLIDQLKDTSDPIQWYEVAMLVGDFGTNAEPAISLLIAALGTSDDIIMGHAAIALGETHRQPDVCVPALIPLLSSPSVSTRQKSLGALSAFGAAATSAVPAMTSCLTDSDPWVRMLATNILKDIAPEAARMAGVK
jgi:HEAT repeat protein